MGSREYGIAQVIWLMVGYVVWHFLATFWALFLMYFKVAVLVSWVYFGAYGTASYAWLKGTLAGRATKALLVPIPGLLYLLRSGYFSEGDIYGTYNAAELLNQFSTHAVGILVAVIYADYRSRKTGATVQQ